MTYEELVVMAEGKREQVKQQMQVSWEQMRWLNFYTILPHKKKHSKLKLKDIAVFPWEKPSTEHHIKTIEELDKVRAAVYAANKVKMPDSAQNVKS